MGIFFWRILPTKEIQLIFRFTVITVHRYVLPTTNAIFTLIMLRNYHVFVPSMIHWVDLILHDTSNVVDSHQELFRNTKNHRKSQRNQKVRRTKINIYIPVYMKNTLKSM